LSVPHLYSGKDKTFFFGRVALFAALDFEMFFLA
jgi:hypothetical protein